MKILGIGTGRRGGNTETLLRHALKACKEEGHEVELIRLLDYDIKPCGGCVACMIKGKDEELPRPCVFDGKDDCRQVLEKIVHCDGLILAAPNMDLMPNAPIINLTNRSIAINERGRYLRKPGSVPEYSKITATIGLGGSDWTQMHMPILNVCAIWLAGARNVLADQMLVQHIETQGLVGLISEYTERAELLGHNLCQELGKAEGGISYHGIDMPEACPICHCDALILRAGKLVCPLCNISGKPVMFGELIDHIEWEAGNEMSHWSKYGKIDHDKNTDWFVERDSNGRKVYHNNEIERIAEHRKKLEDVVKPTLPKKVKGDI